MTDQALHDISYRLRERASPDDDIGILLSCMSRFLSLETLWAAVKTYMWNSDAEDILIETGLCKQGKANKCFASAGDY